MLVYHPVDGGETETRSFAYLLGGKEGVEDVLLYVSSIPVPVSETENKAYLPV